VPWFICLKDCFMLPERLHFIEPLNSSLPEAMGEGVVLLVACEKCC